MASSHRSPSRVAEARQVLAGWREIVPTPSIGPLTPETMQQTLDELAAVQAEIAALNAQLTDRRNRRDTLYDRLNEEATRVRAGIKAIYSDNASEYEMVGGTRRSERKPRARRGTVQKAPS